MIKRFLPKGLLTVALALSAISFTGQAAFAKPKGPPTGPPGAAEASDMPWQVAALFTANWVLVAVAVAMMSRPTKRADKPKKKVDEEAQ